MLKSLLLVSNYKCPNKCIFTVYITLFVIFLNFLRWNLPKFSQYIESGGIWILNTKKVGFVQTVFLIFANWYLFPLRKNWSDRIPWKWAPAKVKCLLPVCQILRNFTKGNTRKFTVSFAFCAHVDVIKNRKILTFSFEQTQITEAFVLDARIGRKL